MVQERRRRSGAILGSRTQYTCDYCSGYRSKQCIQRIHLERMLLVSILVLNCLCSYGNEIALSLVLTYHVGRASAAMIVFVCRTRYLSVSVVDITEPSSRQKADYSVLDVRVVVALAGGYKRLARRIRVHWWQRGIKIRN